MKKRIAIFGGANLTGAVLGMLGSIWAANLAGPSLMGIFNTLQLLAIYAPILGVGIFNGLNRELPYSIGAGKIEEANTLASVSLYVCGLACMVASAGLLLVAVRYRSDPVWFSGVCAYALIVPFTLYRTYLEVTFRTSHDFAWLSLVKVVTAAASLLLVLLMYWDAWGGLMARALLIALLGTYLLWHKRPFIVNPAWNAGLFNRLIRVGLPIFIVGFLYLFFVNVDRLLIISEFDAEALGLYTPSLLILQGMSILPISVAQVIYPHAAEHFGRENSINRLAKVLFMPVLLMLLIQIPFVILTWVYMNELVLYFMPRFEAGIEAARWALLVGLGLSLTSPAIIFNVVRRQAMYAMIMVLSIFLVFIVWKINFVGGLAGIAVAMFAGSVMFSVLCALGAWYLIVKDRHGTSKEKNT